MTSWSRRKPKAPRSVLYTDGGEHTDPDKMVERVLELAAKAPDKIVNAGCGAWTVCFTKKHPQLGTILSMKVRRSTVEEDWVVLGRVAARMGAPPEATPKTIEMDAEATHYWIWGYDPSVKSIVDTMTGRA